MIPIDDSLCQYIDFSYENDLTYKDLLEKEYQFLKSLKNDILIKAIDLYDKQIQTNTIKSCYCNLKYWNKPIINI